MSDWSTVYKASPSTDGTLRHRHAADSAAPRPLPSHVIRTTHYPLRPFLILSRTSHNFISITSPKKHNALTTILIQVGPHRINVTSSTFGLPSPMSPPCLPIIRLADVSIQLGVRYIIRFQGVFSKVHPTSLPYRMYYLLRGHQVHKLNLSRARDPSHEWSQHMLATR